MNKCDENIMNIFERKIRRKIFGAVREGDPQKFAFKYLHHIITQFIAGDGRTTDLDAIVSNAIAATIPKWRTFKLLRWMHNLHQST
jgi:hypothetical protein